MKKNQALFLPIVLLILLPGCLFKKDGVEVEKKKSRKKVALVDNAKGLPVTGVTDEGKFFDAGVEAFVLEEADLDAELSRFDAEREMQLARADIEKEPLWKEDPEFDERFEPILFDFDKHSIREDQKTTLAFDIEQAKKAAEDGSTITLAGHSDSHFASELYNIAKSEKRAHSVAQQLQNEGIPQDKIKVIGYGDKQKAVDSPGKEERNRRVEFIKLTATA
jgi:outer membrane protein OmpA-like peptidoglycan-associated protein